MSDRVGNEKSRWRGVIELLWFPVFQLTVFFISVYVQVGAFAMGFLQTGSFAVVTLHVAWVVHRNRESARAAATGKRLLVLLCLLLFVFFLLYGYAVWGQAAREQP